MKWNKEVWSVDFDNALDIRNFKTKLLKLLIDSELAFVY